MQSLAFPLRLQDNGLLARGDRTASLLALLQVMARTPAGSWAACPSFGLRDLFENAHQRADIPHLALLRINETFAELGIDTCMVTEVVRESGSGGEMNNYSVLLEITDSAETFTALVSHEP